MTTSPSKLESNLEMRLFRLLLTYHPLNNCSLVNCLPSVLSQVYNRIRFLILKKMIHYMVYRQGYFRILFSIPGYSFIYRHGEYVCTLDICPGK